MHVEDRLRRGLEANATSFVPEGEWRLAELHRRRRHRTVTVLVAACAAAAVLAVGLLGGRGSQPRMLPGPAQPSPDTTEVSGDGWAGSRLPDATWSRVATEARAAALGVPERAVAEHLGEDGRLPLALTVVDGTWAITITGDTGEVEVGDFGTVAYAGDGDLVTTSASSGCPGCEAVLAWRVDGDDLVIESADDRMTAVERLVTEGRWLDRTPLASTAASAGDCSSTRARPAREEDIMDKNTVVALSVLATLAAACSDDTDRDASASAEPPETQASESSGDRVVESGWERETTEDQARDLGLSQRTISRYVGADGVLPLGMKLQQQTYAIYVVDDAGRPRTYDLGSYSYDDEGRLVLTTSSTACADCATTLDWQQEGDRLIIDEVSGRGTTALDRLVWHGAWTD